ncbi:MAG: MBL fold metallo-hydrolase [Candidatus Acidiferrales bacterium]
MPDRIFSRRSGFALLAAVAFAGCTTATVEAPTRQPRTRVILLGTGTPNADPERHGTSTAIVVDDAVYIVDFGPGVVRRAAAAKLPMPKLTRAFVTHLHSDHTAGYADLIFTPWVLDRTEPLEVYGPPGLRKMTEHIAAAYAEDIDVRINGLEPANTTGHKVNPHEITPGVIYKDDKVTVKAFAVPHGSWKHAYGYRFETPDRVIVISGDTTASDAVAENARGADVLLHEVICGAGLAQRSPDWKAYHSAFHTTAPDLGRIAARAQPKLLVLHHVLLSGCTEQHLLDEIRAAGFTGRTVIGNDLDVF